jgi:hypothetical protein
MLKGSSNTDACTTAPLGWVCNASTGTAAGQQTNEASSKSSITYASSFTSYICLLHMALVG